MPKISIIIPTHDRLEMLKRAIGSVLAQTYTDWELIVVDDHSEPSARSVIESFADSRIHFIRHEMSQGGAAARNSGIREACGNYIAFLDDDDEWIPEKLTIQMERFSVTGPEVGFCFSAVENIYDDRREISKVADGVQDHFLQALGNPKGYLTVTLIIKREVFDRVGLFDESLPSHQESDLIMRAAKYYKGLGVNRPLVRVNMRSGYGRIGSKPSRRILGREMLIKKHYVDMAKYPDILAFHYFQLGLWHRSIKKYREARRYFWCAFQTHPSFRSIAHSISMLGDGALYRLINSIT